MDTKHRFRSLVVRVVFLVLFGWAVALVRAVHRGRGWDDWTDTNREWKPVPLPEDDKSDERRERRPFRAHKLATSMGLVVVFFAAASFSAGAGDMVGKALDPARCAALMQVTGEDDSVCAELMEEPSAPEATPLAEPDPAAAPAEAEAAEPSAEPSAELSAGLSDELAAGEVDAGLDPAAAAELAAADPAATDASLGSEPAAPADPAAAPTSGPESYVLAPEAPAAKATSRGVTRHWVVRRAKESKIKAPAVEHEGGAPTVWLNRALPDPTPPAKRLSPKFAKNLQRMSAVNGVSWSLVLGVLRAEGARGRVPATVRELNALARGLSQRGATDSEWNAVLSLSGRTGFADRAVALARYNRVVGLRSLVNGLEAEKKTLAERLLRDQRISMYGGGREDVQEGRIDVRVTVLISYLAESYGEVTVSSLFSGHRKYARPGVVSAHIFGHAVDVASVGNLPIAGHQQPGSITEKAVRSILMLPVEIQPRQVISLLGLGGSSFPLADHDDHIHVGF
jgi:hypothetical protein